LFVVDCSGWLGAYDGNVISWSPEATFDS